MSETQSPPPAAAPFDLRFTLTRTEFLTAHRAHLGRSLLSFRTFMLITLALSLGALQAQLFGGKELALRIFGALWVVVIAFVGYAYLGLPIKIFRERPELSREQRVRVGPEGVTLEEGEYLPWEGIDGLFEKDGFLLLTRKHRLPIAIPLRLFSTATERESFREVCAHGFFGRTENRK